jgi:uncharacterized protein (TIGR03435 family)
MRTGGAIAVAVAGLSLLPPIPGSAQAATPLHFEAASVKMPEDQSMFQTGPKRTVGRLRWTTQMAYLLGYAYHMEWWRISGDTPGFGSIYQIEATFDPKATDDQVRLMMQSLLSDRFQMTFHRMTKEVDGFALTVAKDRPKMREANAGDVPALPEWMRGPGADPADMEAAAIATLQSKGVGAITGRSATMMQFSETLQRLLSTAVLDLTGLSRKYYFGFRYAMDADPDIPYPNLVGAIKELGLRLDKRNVPVEMLVVDHMAKIPTEN